MVATPSLFRRLQQYPRRPGRDPVEDRLTEGLAATLDAAPDAARFLISSRFPALPTTGRLTIRTQVRESGANRIDLEVEFAGSGGTTRVWFENKVASPVEPAQGLRYVQRLQELQQEGRHQQWGFSWICPATATGLSVAPAYLLPAGHLAAARYLTRYLGASLPDQRDQYGPTLVDNFITHLAEEAFRDTQRGLHDADFLSLATYQGASAKIKILARQVGEKLQEDWGEVSFQYDRPANFYYHYYHLLPGWPTDSWLEFNGRDDFARLSPRGDLVFGAGPVVEVRHLPDAVDLAGWREALEALGFEINSPREYLFVMRYLPFAEVAAFGADLDSQVTQLATWASAAFNDAVGFPPPSVGKRPRRTDRLGPPGSGKMR